MSRSFEIVENKVEESIFFLRKLQERNFNGLDEPQFYLSAFLSSTRSITFALQASISNLNGFKEWYANERKVLRENKIAKFFLNLRNENQKIGFYPIGHFTLDSRMGTLKFYFKQTKTRKNQYIPKEDVVFMCEIYFKEILILIHRVFLKFGHLIDPQLFYLKSTGLKPHEVIDETNMNNIFIEFLGVDKFGQTQMK